MRTGIAECVRRGARSAAVQHGANGAGFAGDFDFDLTGRQINCGGDGRCDGEHRH